MISEKEKAQLNEELAQKVCELEGLMQRKLDFVGGMIKEIKLLKIQILDIARELHADALDQEDGKNNSTSGRVTND
jgi:hypothetical protein